ncbi:retrovirus-related pol polyprotein from transposon TNT 1-94 [Tanacetum coccineum]
MGSNEETNAAGTDTRPPMLVESDTYLEDLIHRKLDSEFSEEENKLEMADTQAEIILSQGLPRHIFNNLNQTSTAKEIWDNVEMLMQGSAYEPHAKKTLKKQEQSTSIVDPLAYVAHTTSAPALSSPSTPSHPLVQPTIQSMSSFPQRTYLEISPIAYLPTEISSQASKPATPATPFVHKSRPPSQVLASLQKVNAVFPQFEVPPRSKLPLLSDLRSACDREHTKVLELEAEISKQKQLFIESEKRVKPTSGASKTVPKRAPRNHSSLPVKSANARRVEAHHRTLNKKNRVNSNLLVKHSVSVSDLNNVCGACNKSLVFANHTDCLVMCDGSVNVKPHQTKRFKRQPRKEWKPIKRVWKPISKPVANSKPQWKPTGRHFSLFEKYPLTRIMESTDMPIELPPSASSSPKITMVSRFTDHKLSNRQAGSKGISASPVCLLTKASSTKSWLWHRRLNHLNFGTLNELTRKNLVRGLPMLKYDKDHLCPSCQLGKSKKASHPLKTENTNTEVLHTLHMDLYGPMRTESINGKKYVLVIVDDYTRFGWVRFLRTKDETPQVIEKFIVKTQRALNATVRFVRTDNGTEFVNKTLDGWFESVGISHETSVPRSPQQNGVVERRNRTLMEAARTMLIFSKAPMFLWAEAMATACLFRYLPVDFRNLRLMFPSAPAPEELP